MRNAWNGELVWIQFHLQLSTLVCEVGDLHLLLKTKIDSPPLAKEL